MRSSQPVQLFSRRFLYALCSIGLETYYQGSAGIANPELEGGMKDPPYTGKICEDFHRLAILS
jgi:hypothetical protein